MKTIVIIIAILVLAVKAIDMAEHHFLVPQVRTDTVHVMTTVYDTVVSRAVDTVSIVVKQVGPLTERDVVQLVCGGTCLVHDDKRDQFKFNAYGMVFCPKG